MASKNLHDSPFSEETLLKLEIFEKYTQAWLPTFVMSKRYKNIYIFDFFAGTGYDLDGKKGSPIRVLDKVNEQLHHIKEQNVQIYLYFNEYDKKKSELLKNACDDYLQKSKISELKLVTVMIESQDFKDAYLSQFENIKNNPSLVFLDQNGIRFLHEDYFIPLTQMQRTDFLYFASSSYFWRFGETDEFKKLGIRSLKEDSYSNVHRSLVKALQEKITNPKMKLYPFSIKKDTNIYGIIFGASHVRAVDKFLSLVWKMNKENGEANYDIKQDSQKAQLNLFSPKSLTKKEEFEDNLRKKILDKTLTTNKTVLDFVYSEGHIPEHAKSVLVSLKKDKKIFFANVSPLVTYENVYKNEKIIEYEIL